MRVAYVAFASVLAGAERSLEATLSALPGAGIEPVVICPRDGTIAPWCEERGIPVLGAELATRDRWHPLRWWRRMRALRATIRRSGAAVVHSNQVYSYQIAGAAARGLVLPRVCHMRNEVSAEAVRWFCSPGVEAVISISRHIARQVAAAWPEGGERPRLETILNPVSLPDLGAATDRERRRLAARERLGLDARGTVFGFIGQLAPVKGLLELLEALAPLAGRPGWQLAVAGRDSKPGAPYEAASRERASALGLGDRVRFLGFLEDAEAFYRAVDVAVVPSLEEPLGRVPLEAGSYARPSIAFAVGGLPETIRDGETGWLVPDRDVGALARALRGVLERSDRDAAGEAARTLVERVCEPGAYARRLAALYESLRF